MPSPPSYQAPGSRRSEAKNRRSGGSAKSSSACRRSRRQQVEEAEKRVQAIESVRDARTSAWQAATRLKEGVERFTELSTERDEVRKRLRSLEDRLTKERERLAAFRDKQGLTFGRITEKFSAIIRRLINENAKEPLTLSGDRLQLTVDVDGDRRTAAIESLKVLAFDLACLCLSIEGATRIPHSSFTIAPVRPISVSAL